MHIVGHYRPLWMLTVALAHFSGPRSDCPHPRCQIRADRLHQTASGRRGREGGRPRHVGVATEQDEEKEGRCQLNPVLRDAQLVNNAGKLVELGCHMPKRRRLKTRRARARAVSHSCSSTETLEKNHVALNKQAHERETVCTVASMEEALNCSQDRHEHLGREICSVGA